MRLKIDGGFLFKPYAAPCSPDEGHTVRQGWMPDRTPAMQAAFAELRAEPGDVPDRLLWLRVESDEGERLAARRRPWPGWMVVGPRSDKAISRAYRALYVRMNPGVNVLGATPRSKTVVPPDGDYVFEGGGMRPGNEEPSLPKPPNASTRQDGGETGRSGRRPLTATIEITKEATRAIERFDVAAAEFTAKVGRQEGE